MTPILNTSRLVLRPLIKATQRQIDWLLDPRVVEFSEQRHHPHSLATQQRYIANFLGHLWSIHDVTSDRHIGNLSAAADLPNGIAELGILIGDREVWGRGFATEAWKAASEWLIAKDDGGFRKLEAGCMAVNLAMRRIFFHAGFQFEGERKNHFLWNGQMTGLVYFGKFR